MLDQPFDPAAPVSLTGEPDASRSSHLAEDRSRLADEFAAALREIRALDEFACFGLPPTTDELLAQAAIGPVVVFNVSPYRSDALLLTDEGITSVELPSLTYDTVIDQVNAFHRALDATANRDAQATLSGILEWLWDTAAEPVLRALGHHSLPPDVAWPRVWWAPGGLLGLLPVHAAGHHTDPPGDYRRTVMDRVISSYTPTIRALRYARESAPRPATQLRALIVAMPTTPGVPGRLNNAAAEAAKVASRLPGSIRLAEPDAYGGDPDGTSEHVPTKANVLARLPGCAIAHFACHGESDPTDPSKSLLLLHDHNSDPLTVASLAPIRLDQAQLAYLSACRTASSRTASLIDEAIHLASAFQLAGFPHVIGTLWEIVDDVAVDVADTFYADLRTSDGTLDTSRAARALHNSVRAVRDKLPAAPFIWAAYLHAGA